MIITQVVVGVHEKRNHPHEYGHRDASVRLSATLESEDLGGRGPALQIQSLRKMARGHVEAELNLWEERVREKHRIANLIENIENQLDHWVGPHNWQEKGDEITELVKQLPENIRGEYAGRLFSTLSELKKKREELDRQAEERRARAETEEDPDDIGF